jgi:hypothetical protein
MAEKKTYAPFSQVAEGGTTQAPVDGYVSIPDSIQPTINAGRVGTDGKWIIEPVSDDVFHSLAKDEGIPNTGEILAPQSVTGTGAWPLDMTGFRSLFIAIKPTNAGNYAIKAIMGPATFAFANLKDVNAGATIKRNGDAGSGGAMESAFEDSSEALTADVWNIFYIGYERLANQKLLQFSITNNSGGESDIETAFMRLV